MTCGSSLYIRDDRGRQYLVFVVFHRVPCWSDNNQQCSDDSCQIGCVNRFRRPATGLLRNLPILQLWWLTAPAQIASSLHMLLEFSGPRQISCLVWLRPLLSVPAVPRTTESSGARLHIARPLRRSKARGVGIPA